MYRPRGGGGAANQTGGDYTSTVNAAGITLDSMSAIALSTLMADQKLSSFADIANLSIDQIGALINTVEGQLNAEAIVIASAQRKITEAQAAISMPGGLQDKYDESLQNANSTQVAYNKASTLAAGAAQYLLDMEAELSSISSVSDSLQHTMEIFEDEFSSLVREIGATSDVVEMEEERYNRQKQAYDDYTEKYKRAMDILISTTEARDYVSSLAAEILRDYVSTSTHLYTLEVQYEKYRTITVPEAEYIARSTAAYYSSLMELEDAEIRVYISTSTALHIAQLNYSSAQTTAEYDDAVLKEVCTISELNTAKNMLSYVNTILGTPDPYQHGGGTQLQNLTIEQETLLNTYFPNATFDDLVANSEYYTKVASNLSNRLAAVSQERKILEATQGTIQLITLNSILDHANKRISDALGDLYLAKANETNIFSTISSLSTQIIESYLLEEYYNSTLYSLSSNYQASMAQWYQRSTSVASYNADQIAISNQLASTLSTIDYVVELSTNYARDLETYKIAYALYSTIEANTTSSIAGYTLEDSYILSSIYAYSSLVSTMYFSTATGFSDLTNYAATFYTNTGRHVRNTALEYQYATQELTAVVGANAAQLNISRLVLYTQLDTLNLALIANPNDTASGERRTNVLNVQNTLQTIITAINPLDVMFKRILQLCQEEQQLLGKFVELRSKLTNYEISVLKDSSLMAGVHTDYIDTWSLLYTTVQSINSVISNKNSMLDSIYTILNPQITAINGLDQSILGQLLAFPDTITVGQIPMILPSSDPNQMPLDKYAILPPIDFTPIGLTGDFRIQAAKADVSMSDTAGSIKKTAQETNPKADVSMSDTATNTKPADGDTSTNAAPEGVV
jgi:hypothetical protein